MANRRLVLICKPAIITVNDKPRTLFIINRKRRVGDLFDIMAEDTLVIDNKEDNVLVNIMDDNLVLKENNTSNHVVVQTVNNNPAVNVRLV